MIGPKLHFSRGRGVLQNILESIADFTVPKIISDIRGWFGFVNQVASFFANRRVMELFREFLKPPARCKKVY